MDGDEDGDEDGRQPGRSGLRHDMRQPLNVIAMAVANLRARAAQDFASLDQGYLTAKLDRIDKKLIELEDLIARV